MAVIKEMFTMTMPVEAIECDECGMEFVLFCVWDKAENEDEVPTWLGQPGWYINEERHSELYCPYCGIFVHNKPTRQE